MKESRPLVIRTREREFTVPSGKPVMIRYKTKNKTRSGIAVSLGWIMPGDRPHTVTLVPSCFQTWDEIEKEYPFTRTIWSSSIEDIKILSSVKN